MKIAALTKVALCVCPPAIVATSALTVPPVRRAIHHLTAPHHHGIRHRSPRTVLARARCGQGGATGGGSAGPASLRTFADAGPTDLATGPLSPFETPAFVPGGQLPDFGNGLPGDYRAPIAAGVVTPGGIVPAVSGGGGGVPGVAPLVPGSGASTVDSAVPEPSVWALMVAGVGGIGVALRRRQQTSRAARVRSVLSVAGLSLDLASVLPVEHLGAAASTAGVGAKSTKTALLAKAVLCVCPPALLATTVATVPPVRHAVYAATAPREHLRGVGVALPCDPDVASDAAVSRAKQAANSLKPAPVHTLAS